LRDSGAVPADHFSLSLVKEMLMSGELQSSLWPHSEHLWPLACNAMASVMLNPSVLAHLAMARVVILAVASSIFRSDVCSPIFLLLSLVWRQNPAAGNELCWVKCVFSTSLASSRYHKFRRLSIVCQLYTAEISLEWLFYGIIFSNTINHEWTIFKHQFFWYTQRNICDMRRGDCFAYFVARDIRAPLS
jgi:hypothetical protein